MAQLTTATNRGNCHRVTIDTSVSCDRRGPAMATQAVNPSTTRQNAHATGCFSMY